MTLNYYIEEKKNNREESLNNYIYLFSNYEKNIPTLDEALNQIYMSEVFDNEKANYSCLSLCYLHHFIRLCKEECCYQFKPD